VWYWGDKLHVMQELNLEHHQLLDLAGGKPFMLLAGEADNAASYEAMQKSSVYKNHPEYLQIIDHATGHRPPQHVLEAGYDFLDKFLR
jgi:predicted esterase